MIQLFITRGMYEIFFESTCDISDGTLTVAGNADASPNIFQAGTNVTSCDASYTVENITVANDGTVTSEDVIGSCNCTSGCVGQDPFTVELACGPEPELDVHCTNIFDLAAGGGSKNKNKDKNDKDRNDKEKDKDRYKDDKDKH